MKITYLALTILITYFATLGLIPFLKFNFGQTPNKRSSHNKLTPSAGGIVFIFISLFFSFLSSYFRLILYLPLALIGLYDDKYELNPLLRYLVQLITVILITLISIDNGLLSFLKNDISYLVMIFCLLISIVFGTAIINFINFMDGIDGLVAGSSIIFLTTVFFTHNNNVLPLIGALLGFIILNWNPAKIFMGDVGSTFLGAVIFGEIFINSNFKESFGLFLVIIPILGDAFFCVIRRYFAKQNIFKPHKLHLYQRLCSNGWSHSKVTSIYLLSSIFISLAYIIINLEIALISSIAILFVGFLIDKKFALPFKKAISK